MPATVSIVIPTLNEAANLPHVLPRIPKLPEISEVILVDGHSTDGTVEVARELLPDIRVVNQPGKGKGNAIKAGARAATGDYFLVIDADGSMAPEEIGLYIEKAKQGYEFVKGSRYADGGRTEDETFDRGFMVRLTDLVANIMWQTRFEDMAYGMFLVDRRKFAAMEIRSDYFEVEWEILLKAARDKLRIARVPAVEAARIHGESHLTYRRDGWLIFKLVMLEGIKGTGAKVWRLLTGRPARRSRRPAGQRR
jgi:glycosyltransferase involved in cell wall biosynthesis